jgi:hypothetical protein
VVVVVPAMFAERRSYYFVNTNVVAFFAVPRK